MDNHRDRPDRRHRAAGYRPRGCRPGHRPTQALRAAPGSLRPRVRAHRRPDRRPARRGGKALRAREAPRELDDPRPERRGARPASPRRGPAIQRGFVDDPVSAVRTPPTPWSTRSCAPAATRSTTTSSAGAEDISVEHPKVVHHYREARETRVATENGVVDTEQQRHAVTSYRALIEALLGPSTDTSSTDDPDSTGTTPTTRPRSTHDDHPTTHDEGRRGGLRGAVDELFGRGERTDDDDVEGERRAEHPLRRRPARVRAAATTPTPTDPTLDDATLGNGPRAAFAVTAAETAATRPSGRLWRRGPRRHRRARAGPAGWRPTAQGQFQHGGEVRGDTDRPAQAASTTPAGRRRRRP